MRYCISRFERDQETFLFLYRNLGIDVQPLPFNSCVSFTDPKAIPFFRFLGLLRKAAQPWGPGPSMAPSPRAKHPEAFAMDGGSR